MSGTFAKGDYAIAQNGHVWICTVAGTPGTWVDADNIVSLGSATKATGRHFKILNRDAILADPEPEWLIEGLYTQDSIAQVFGNPEAYKTFFALAVAFSVATGKLFLGTHKVKRFQSPFLPSQNDRPSPMETAESSSATSDHLPPEVARMRALHHIQDAAEIISDAMPYVTVVEQQLYASIVDGLSSLERHLADLKKS